jgi:hypothetical protein
MKMENLLDRLFCNYVLVINKASGIYVRRYFDTFDQMEDYAIYLQFTPNVKKAWGMCKNNHRWVRCFTLR